MKAICFSFWRQLTLLGSMACNSAGTSVLSSASVSSSHGKSDVSVSDKDADDAGNLTCVRLNSVAGDGDKENDLLFCGNLVKGKEHVVFFGGDVQDFRDNMLAHRDNQRHVRWCFEEMAQLLHQRFPEGNIWIVKPSAMYLKTLSVFCNFVKTNGIGTPTFNANYGSVEHLAALLSNGVRAVLSKTEASQGVLLERQGKDTGKCPKENNGDSEVTEKELTTTVPLDGTRHKDLDSLPIRLIGFSKGSVVLNQILHELHRMDTDEPISNQLSRIKAFYWLDGGHAGNSNTWITDVTVLQHLSKLNVELHVHVTPYQMEDSMRPWIAKEQKKFVSKLRNMGVKIMETKHFENEERSIDIHFRILEAF